MSDRKFTKEVGFVTNAKGYLLSLNGLPSARINDILVDEEDNKAIVVSLKGDNVTALLLNNSLAKSGNKFFLLGKSLGYSIGDHMFGRIVNVFGEPIDGKGSFPKDNTTLTFERVAPGVSKRQEITEQFETGISVVDVLYPIGKGQRQLLFGPTSSGKTTFIRDIIINQKGKDVICIYAGIGKGAAFMERFAKSIFSKGANEYTILLGALAEEQTSVASIAPTTALFIAEYFQKQGKEVLLVIDDLGAHAKYMREIALLMGQVPGRQSYPGDIFYQHAHLLELAGNFNEEHGGGSITLLPVLETDTENFTDLIPTNLMAMTDGHLFFDPSLRSEGYYPSIAIDRSVTRVGRQTQKSIQKDLSTKIMMLFAEFRKQEEYSRFGTNLSGKTKDTLRNGELILELLKQIPYENLKQDVQIALLSLVFTTFLSKRERPFLQKHKSTIINALLNDSRLEDVRKTLKEPGLKLETFIKEFDTKSNILDSVCRQ
jgi:F-type H+-transporting ATPase subunit alpha